MTLAAVCFAVCHLLVMATDPTAASLQDEIPRQLIHWAAELCRFAVPLCMMTVGIIQQLKRH